MPALHVFHPFPTAVEQIGHGYAPASWEPSATMALHGAGVGRQEVAEVLVHPSSNSVAIRWQAAQRWQAMANVPIAGLTASDAAAAKFLLRLPILQAQTPAHHPLTSTLRACSLMHTPLSFWSSSSSGCEQHLADWTAVCSCPKEEACILIAISNALTRKTCCLVAGNGFKLSTVNEKDSRKASQHGCNNEPDNLLGSLVSDCRHCKCVYPSFVMTTAA